MILVLFFLLVLYIYFFNYNKDNKESFDNIVNPKMSYSEYYMGSPYSNEYTKTLWKVYNETMVYLRRPEIRNIHNKTVIMDIDDTLLMTHNEKYIKRHLDPIVPMVRLFKDISKLGYIIIIITARPPESLGISYENMYLYGMYPYKIYTSVYYGQPQTFKAQMRIGLEYLTPSEILTTDSKQLLNINPNSRIKPDNHINVVLSIGDRWTDITGMPNVLGIKLPEDSDINAYFWYNNNTSII